MPSLVVEYAVLAAAVGGLVAVVTEAAVRDPRFALSMLLDTRAAAEAPIAAAPRVVPTVANAGIEANANVAAASLKQAA
ncbi:hypothetical protein [Propylenella binzhouense]|uniref:Uncharacterized protein n=1 Tax=Propylenella binzhouense TaxID=2555902 RepID=A0A964T5J1_9HYPH|nr:hypothetical protein [Propylenella binzhouense]MYZ48916.1 hypothetical protein [Propylenella binzhouense]